MRGFNLLLFGFVFGIGALFAQADTPPVPSAGTIGCTLARMKSSGFLTIDYVAAGSSAAEAGMKKDDGIAAINGISTKGMSVTEAKRSIEGSIGSVVKLTVRRESSIEQQVSIVRRSFPETYLPAATAGDPKAQVTLGVFYEHGPTATIDHTLAAEWYRKAANQGDAVGERDLAFLYHNGQGVKQSDKDAFAWFYSAALQDEPKAEYNLGLIYENGRGVDRDYQQAFYWYDRAARHNVGFAEWNLAYLYEEGTGVKQDMGEAMKWYQKALVALPDNKDLEMHMALLSLRIFVENPNSASIDPALIMTVFGRWIMPLFYFLTLIYVVGGVALFYFSFRTPEIAPGISVALGWLAFQMEGQAVALFALFILGAALTADTLFVATCLFSALPVIASTLGPNRHRIWKASAASWKTLFLYGIGSYVVVFILLVGYGKIYVLLTHSSLPGQSTEVLISKAKHGSVWLAYACIALALPLTEEILFRGYLFEALRRRFSGTIVIIITAFAFALVHLQGLYFAPLFGFGLIQGWLRLKTDSLRLPALLHMLNNALFIALASS